MKLDHSSFSLFKSLLLLSFLILSSTFNLTAQKVTIIKGRVFDAQTKEPLPFVDITLKGTYVGASTDLDGRYEIKTKNPSEIIQCSFIGYKTIEQSINLEERQQINFYLEEEGVKMESVTILAKKGRYRKKNNPAVDLMRKVIENRDRNRLESQEFYSYDKHEKLELDVNNITEEFKDGKLMRNFDFMWDFLDTSKVNGRTYLPLYMREVLSDVHYRSDPESKKEIRKAIQMTEFDSALDVESISNTIDALYEDVNLYDNSIKLLDNDFLSPMAPWALNYYRFYILDTTIVNNKESIHLAFIPRNKTFIGFTGDVYISNDNRYTLLKAVLSITKDISMNFVRDIKIVQEFSEKDSVYFLSKDEITLDVALSDKGMGVYSTRINTFDNHSFAPPDDFSIFNGSEELVEADDAYQKGKAYWRTQRLDPLSEKQEGIYEMIDTLKTVAAYKNLVYWTKVATTGYIPAGPLDVGQISTAFSKNDVEGWRFRLGLETAYSFTKQFQVKTYLAYGTKDKTFKYRGLLHYSFNGDYRENPKQFLEVSYRHDVVFPGLKLEFIEDDNFLTSIRRGTANQMLFIDSYNVDFFNEGKSGYYKVGLEHRKRQAYEGGEGGVGTLRFRATRDDQIVDIPDVSTTEASLAIEWSPNTTFIQGREKRKPIISDFPTVQFSYKGGFKVAGGDYSYHNISLLFKKRVPMSIVGRSLIEAEVGRIFGKNLPFVLLYIPRANQAYSFQPTSFNTMNFLEFATDKYIRFGWQHFFDGFIFNRIPLWNKLKLKEVISAKIVHGGLDDANDPRLNPELIQFNTIDGTDTGTPLTYAFEGSKPYIEYGFGIYNIFRFLRLDLIKRANYLDHPNIEKLFGVKGLGLRARFKVEF